MKDKKQFHTYRGYQKIRQDKKSLTPSMEDYLEMIYRTCLEDGYTRMKDIAKKLNVKVPSTTKTVQKLAKMDYVKYEKYGIIQITPKGKKKGEFLLKRHKIIENFLKNLGVKEDILNQTEMIEHHLNKNTVRYIESLNIFFKKNPDILKKFIDFRNKNIDNC